MPVLVNGKETFPLVPVAVGIYSTFFNIFNTAILFPFVGVFERVLLKVGHTSIEDREDYSQPRYLDPRAGKEILTGVPAVQRESGRYLEGAAAFMAIARGDDNAPDDSQEHYAALDVLSKEIRTYTAAMFAPNLPHERADLLASLIEEEDWTASLGETLYQIARRVERQPFSDKGRELVNAILDQVSESMNAITPNGDRKVSAAAEPRLPALQALRDQSLGADLPWAERGAILTLLGSAERAYTLIERIDAERKSVSRSLPAAASSRTDTALEGPGAALPAPA